MEDPEVAMENKEYGSLLFPMSNPDIFFSKELSCEQTEGSDSPDSNATAAAHINRLREKVEKRPPGFATFRQSGGVGYGFWT